mmetsp:Transcript_95808/g.298414  ORF Transcript_95808/g.298414 Transcript_95808/m.298414 type:complete len:200 (-) Transcript_95808:291-890(-)
MPSSVARSFLLVFGSLREASFFFFSSSSPLSLLMRPSRSAILALYIEMRSSMLLGAASLLRSSSMSSSVSRKSFSNSSISRSFSESCSFKRSSSFVCCFVAVPVMSSGSFPPFQWPSALAALSRFFSLALPDDRPETSAKALVLSSIHQPISLRTPVTFSFSFTVKSCSWHAGSFDVSICSSVILTLLIGTCSSSKPSS